jgi:molybdate transport system regulatory protein
MSKTTNDNSIKSWVEGELRLAGMLDSRMIALLRAIHSTGSINQAAKLQGLSYKGAWQIIERANNGAPQILISTAIGGSKGGGTRLTEAGRALLALFTELETQHQQFIAQLNQSLADKPDAVLLLQRMMVKSSARNQLFGSVSAIQIGAVNAEIAIELKDGTAVVASLGLSELYSSQLRVGAEAMMLIDSTNISLVIDAHDWQWSARNCLPCRVIRIRPDDVNAEVVVQLPGGELLSVLITRQSANNMELAAGQSAWAIFKRNAPILGVMTAK